MIEVAPVDRCRRRRADRRPEGRRPRPRPTRRSRTSRAARPGRTSPRPSRPTPRPRRRPATSAGSQADDTQADEAFLDGRLRGRGQHADRGHRGRRRHLPDRPGDRDRPDGGRRRLPGQDPERRHRPRQVPRGRRRRRHPREARGQDRRRRDRARPAAPGLGDLHQATPPTPPRADAIKVRHILYSPEGRPERRGERPGHRSGLGGGPGRGRRDVRQAQGRPEPVRLDRARRERRGAAPRARAGTGGKLPYFDSTSQVDPAFLKAILARASSPATSCRRSSRPSAGTSSRS